MKCPRVVCQKAAERWTISPSLAPANMENRDVKVMLTSHVVIFIITM